MPKCKCCKIKFEPKYFNQKFCLSNDECLKKFALYAKTLTNKKKRIETKKTKESMLTRSEWLNIAQKVFNTYIRQRDKGLNCISCGTITGQMHCGHYMSIGSNPQLRFNEDNCHKQCAKCNNYLSGNLILYRKNLIKKIGLEEVEKLECDRSVLKLTIPEIKELITEYKYKIKNNGINRND